jgi:Protein of unknown function (DUF3455)
MSKRRFALHHFLLGPALPLLAAGCAAELGPQTDAPDVASATEQLSSSCDDIPTELAVPEGNRFAFEYQALGVQIYQCKPSMTGDPQWVFTAPEATLYDRQGHEVAQHGAGPSWTGVDGSQVIATKLAANSDDTTAIPWLLLQATQRSGTGMFSDVSYVQRLDTRQGLAPTGSCDPSATCGNPLRVPYAATYAFYVPKPKPRHGR